MPVGGNGASRPLNLFGDWPQNLFNPVKPSSPAVNLNLGVFVFAFFLTSPTPPQGAHSVNHNEDAFQMKSWRLLPTTTPHPQLFKDPTIRLSPWPLVSTLALAHSPSSQHPPSTHTPYLPTLRALCGQAHPHLSHYSGGTVSVGHYTGCVVYEDFEAGESP